jgi:hypothetical protein
MIGDTPPSSALDPSPGAPRGAPKPSDLPEVGSEFVLTLWTDKPALAREADAAGVDRVGLDLETRGKRSRQAGLGTWISAHRAEDLALLHEALAHARLFVRVNPLGADTPAEVERLLAFGAQVLMLPMFRSVSEVARFLDIVQDRAEVVLLLETREAAGEVAQLVKVPGVREVHVGINDLALSLGVRNRFELLESDVLQRISACVRDAGVRLGVGGIGRTTDVSLPIPPDLIYMQLVRLGATAALISRAFIRPGEGAEALAREVGLSRGRLSWWSRADEAEIQRARSAFRAAVRSCESW